MITRKDKFDKLFNSEKIKPLKAIKRNVLIMILAKQNGIFKQCWVINHKKRDKIGSENKYTYWIKANVQK